MEFRVLQRMTQHKEHVKNLYTNTKMEFKRQNRYNEVLPCNNKEPIIRYSQSYESHIKRQGSLTSK